jgi:hypothetical protein
MMRVSHLGLCLLISGTAWAATPRSPTNLCIDANCPTSGEVIFQETHDTLTLGTRADGSVEGKWKTTIDGDTTHARVEVRDEDPVIGSSRYLKTTLVKNGSDNFRTERTMNNTFLGSMQSVGNIASPYGQGSEDHWRASQDYWYGFRLRIDSVPDSIGGYYIQWHDNPGGDSRSPPVALLGSKEGLRLRLEKNYDNGYETWLSPIIIAPPFIGIAHDFMFRIRWDTRSKAQGGSGAIDVYVDDGLTPVVSWRGQTNHPGTSTDGRVPYLKWGLYKSAYQRQGTTGATNIQVYDHLKVMGAEGSLAGVKPPPPRN